jgi:two-component system OmpR family sensor kinase
LIARALDNLLENAERHGGGVVGCTLRVELTAAATTAPASPASERAASSAPARGAEHLVFEVRDAGPGFEPRTLPHVFEAFYRAGERAGPGPGSLGLGLALVQRIARAHGGHAWAENVPGGGARVAFSVAL